MDHLAQDLSVALEESEPCGNGQMLQITKRLGLRRRTRSTGNLNLSIDKSLENISDESSSGELSEHHKLFNSRKKNLSVHETDSDEGNLGAMFAVKSNNNSFRTRGHSFSFQSQLARPSIRRKRKLKRMCVDETPVLPSGKRKRPQRMEPIMTNMSHMCSKLKPLNPSIVNKIEKLRSDNCMETSPTYSGIPVESSFLDLTMCDAASESSLSWSGGEGHEGDDELTDWAPQPDPSPNQNDLWTLETSEEREMRAGCRRLRNERPGYSIATGANERVARFMQDVGREELRLFDGERNALARLAGLYCLEWREEGPSFILKKTGRTPCMQPPQRYLSGLSTVHKRIRTQEVLPRPL